MARIIVFFLLPILFVSASAQTKTRKAVFVIIDGVPADVIEKLDLPNFKKVSQQGGFAHVNVGGEKGGYSQSPTVSASGYNCILTGTWVNKHNVWECCSATGINYNYPSIFRLLKTQSPEKKIGIFSSWQDNRTGLVGDALPATGNIAF